MTTQMTLPCIEESAVSDREAVIAMLSEVGAEIMRTGVGKFEVIEDFVHIQFRCPTIIGPLCNTSIFCDDFGYRKRTVQPCIYFGSYNAYEFYINFSSSFDDAVKVTRHIYGLIGRLGMIKEVA